MTIGKTPRRVASQRVPQRNNDGMVALALILLVLVAVLVVAIVVSNPETYDLSIFGAVIPVNSAGIFITGAIAMAVTVLALLLLRSGIRRARLRRKQLKALEASSDNAASECCRERLDRPGRDDVSQSESGRDRSGGPCSCKCRDNRGIHDPEHCSIDQGRRPRGRKGEVGAGLGQPVLHDNGGRAAGDARGSG